MLVNCGSCQKKFSVPDAAITKNGRLLQCGSCGNKWNQYPIKEKLPKDSTNVVPAIAKRPTSIDKAKTLVKKKKRVTSLYSEEYLKKKHGLIIQNSKNDKRVKKNKNKNNFGFYNYFITPFIFIITFFGILNLSKDIIIIKYPFIELYINYLYEALDVMRITIFSLIN